MYKSIVTVGLDEFVHAQRFPALEVLYCTPDDWVAFDVFPGMRLGDSWNEAPEVEQWNATVAAMLEE